MSETLTPVRTLEAVEAELRLIQDQAQRAVLSYAIEAGRRLEEAKAMVDHGGWGPWLKKMGYSPSTAQNLMRIFREYGADQQNLFGAEAKTQAIGDLTYTKALKLLALPDAEEREQFLAEHDVAAMSTRELEQALKEREEALRQAEAARADASAAEEARAKMEKDMKAANASLKDQKARVKTLGREADGLRQELQELRSRPVDVAVETRAPTPEELEALTKDAVEKARAEDAARLATLEKQLAQADGDTAAFKVYFDAWQADYGRMMGHLAKIEARDPEKAEKLKSAVRAAAERMVS